MASPTDGTDDTYQDINVLDDLSDIFLNAWIYVNTMNGPTSPDQVMGIDNIDGAVASPGTAQGLPRHPSPRLTTIQPRIGHPNYIQTAPSAIRNQSPMERRLDLTASSVIQIDEPQPPLNATVQSWIDEAYATGYRFQSPDHWQGSAYTPTIQQHLNETVMLSLPSLSGQSQSSPTHNTASWSSVSNVSHGRLRCDHPGCHYSCWRRCDFQHHLRCHIPMLHRPYECSLCHRRFLYPREVRRHMPSHGLGPRHRCPHERCRFATRGFGRRDNLIRHLRNCH